MKKILFLNLAFFVLYNTGYGQNINFSERDSNSDLPMQFIKDYKSGDIYGDVSIDQIINSSAILFYKNNGSRLYSETKTLFLNGDGSDFYCAKRAIDLKTIDPNDNLDKLLLHYGRKTKRYYC